MDKDGLSSNSVTEPARFFGWCENRLPWLQSLLQTFTEQPNFLQHGRLARFKRFCELLERTRSLLETVSRWLGNTDAFHAMRAALERIQAGINTIYSQMRERLNYGHVLRPFSTLC